jgi:acyl-CoA thioesterase FadM
MTASLEVRYVAPTPLDEPLEVRAQVERIEGRRVHVSAQISAAGRVTATAAGLFIRLTPANVAQIFPARRVPAET